MSIFSSNRKQSSVPKPRLNFAGNWRFFSISCLSGLLIFFGPFTFSQLHARDVDLSVIKIIKDEANINYAVRAKIYPQDPNHLFVTTRGEKELGNNGRLTVYNITKPDNPKMVASWKPDVMVYTVREPVVSKGDGSFKDYPYLKNVLEGQDRYKNTLVVLSINTGTMHLLDVSKPDNPYEISHLSLAEHDILIPFMQLLHVKVYDAGHRQYALMTSPQQHNLIAVDITNPKEPKFVTDVELHYDPLPDKEGAEGVYLHGQYAYCGAFHGSSMKVVDLSGLDDGKLHLVDSLNDDTYNQLVSMIDPRDKYKNILYSAGWGSPGGLLVFDLTKPAAPEKISAVIQDNLSKANRVKLWNNFAFLPQEAEPATIGVVDVTDPHKPEFVKVIPHISDEHGQVINKAYAMAVKSVNDKEAYAYVFGAVDSNMAVVHLKEQ